MRGNFTKNRGAKTLQGRINQLRGLRNVGSKMVTDKKYMDQIYEDGMDFHSKKRKREAAKLDKEFTKVVKDNIVSPHYLNKNYEAPKEFAEQYETGREEHQLTIEEARFINNRNKPQRQFDPSRGYSQVEKEIRMRNYGFKPGIWSPSPSLSEDDDWYGEYARLQRSNKPIY
jgi:hypothetical protein|tara:strand:+ start:380 stop:895 length:516 start_codon:yes stop_codon:yes gene_type:complete